MGETIVENNGKTLGDVDEGRFVTVRRSGALRGHQRCKRVESRYSTRYTTYTLQGKVRRDRNMSETYGNYTNLPNSDNACTDFSLSASTRISGFTTATVVSPPQHGASDNS